MLKTDDLLTFQHTVSHTKAEILRTLGAGPGVKLVSKHREHETAEGSGKWCIFCGTVVAKQLDAANCEVQVQGKMSGGIYVDRVEVRADGSVRISGKPILSRIPISSEDCDLFAFWPDGSDTVRVHRWIRKTSAKPTNAKAGHPDRGLDVIRLIRSYEYDIRMRLGAGPEVALSIQTVYHWRFRGTGTWLSVHISNVEDSDGSPRIFPMFSRGGFARSVEITRKGAFLLDEEGVVLMFPEYRGESFMCYFSESEKTVYAHPWNRNVSQEETDAITKMIIPAAIKDLIDLGGGKNPVVGIACSALKRMDWDAMIIAIHELSDVAENYRQDAHTSAVGEIAPIFRHYLKCATDTPVLMAARRCKMQGPGRWLIARVPADGAAQLYEGEFKDFIEPTSYGAFVDGIPNYVSASSNLVHKAGPLKLRTMDYLAIITEGNRHILVMAIETILCTFH